KQGIDELLNSVETKLLDARKLVLQLPFDQGSLVSKLHEISMVHKEEYNENGVKLWLSISGRDLHLVEPYIIEDTK
ncbi:MAG: GTPase HflX, partial [Candidatus Cloacimonetes bacterium]|nr:GTPase HflX [Candidatus Cloacimonadota bacterium]